MNDNILIHYGKKGMRWGIRRAAKSSNQQMSFVRGLNAKETNARQISQLSNVKGGADSAKSGTDAARNLNATISKRRSQQNIPDISKMSDKDLQQTINRMGMEQRYNDLSASKAVSKGHINVDTALAVTGSVLAIGSSAIGIAVAMKQLKGA